MLTQIKLQMQMQEPPAPGSFQGIGAFTDKAARPAEPPRYYYLEFSNPIEERGEIHLIKSSGSQAIERFNINLDIKASDTPNGLNNSEKIIDDFLKGFRIGVDKFVTEENFINSFSISPSPSPLKEMEITDKDQLKAIMLNAISNQALGYPDIPLFFGSAEGGKDVKTNEPPRSTPARDLLVTKGKGSDGIT